MAIYLNIPEIPGEVAMADHSGEMEVLSMGLGVVQSANPSQASGHSSSEATFSPITVTKVTDSATPLLLQACAQAQHFPEIKFTCTKMVAGGHIPYLTITLSKVLIADVSLSTSSDGSPTESLSFAFSAVTWEYESIGEDGASEGTTAGNFNLETQTVS